VNLNVFALMTASWLNILKTQTRICLVHEYLNNYNCNNYHYNCNFYNYSFQGDHSPDNVKFPYISDGLRHSAAFSMLSVTHIMPVLVLLSVVR